MDIKAPLDAKVQSLKFKVQSYDKATGVKIDLKKIKKSIELVKNSGIDYEFRTTVLPGIHTKEDILQIAKELPPVKKYYLQNFRPKKTVDPACEKIKPYSQKQLERLQKESNKYLSTELRNL
jgi:pyruvate formate lyase activating enzyme